MVSLTGPTLVPEVRPTAVAGPGLVSVELGPAETTADQPEVPGQPDQARPGHLHTVEGLEEVTAGQVESQLPHSEEDLTAGGAGLTPEHLLTVVPALVSSQACPALTN